MLFPKTFVIFKQTNIKTIIFDKLNNLIPFNEFIFRSYITNARIYSF